MIKLTVESIGFLALSSIPAIVYGFISAMMFKKRHGSSKKFFRIPFGGMFGFTLEFPSIALWPDSLAYMILLAIVLGVVGMMCFMIPQNLYLYGKRMD
ncbi:MAG: hypothetical protein WBW92_01750 [Rhodanobacteraceae bacterium]